jgi:hypothetical protein
LRNAVALAAAAAALIVAGCGGDDADTATTSSSTTDATAISVEQWTTQANRICVEGEKATQRTAAQRFGGEPPTGSELDEFGTTVLVPSLQGQHDAIAGLPRPEAEGETIDELLSALQEGIDAIDEDPSVLVQGTDSVPAIQDATALAQELGLTDCGSG